MSPAMKSDGRWRGRYTPTTNANAEERTMAQSDTARRDAWRDERRRRDAVTGQEVKGDRVDGALPDDATRRDAHRASWPVREVTDPSLVTTTQLDDKGDTGYLHDIERPEPENVSVVTHPWNAAEEAA
jgi:hypothetical protein